METYVLNALAAQKARTALPFAIVERTAGRIVGTTRFHSIVLHDRRLELGFTWIGLPWQRTGVNTEAKYLMLRHAFESYDCLRVEFKTDADNQQSRRALVRIGAKPEGVLRNYRVSVLRGVRDLAVYSIIASEWPEVGAALEARLKVGSSERVS